MLASQEMIREGALRLVAQGKGAEAAIWYEAAEAAVPSMGVFSDG